MDLLHPSSRALALALVATGLVALAPAPTSTAAAPPRCFGVRATIVGTGSVDTLIGTAGRDVIVGLGGNDRLEGRGGNDLLCGGRGTDDLDGGDGDDKLDGGLDHLDTEEGDAGILVGDDLWGGRGDDLIRPGFDPRRYASVEPDRIRFDRVARAVTVDLAAGTAKGQGKDRFGTRRIAIQGSARPDLVLGSPRADLVFSGGGSDRIRGRGGDDFLVTDEPDMLGPAGGNDVARGGPGDDQITGYGGFDRLAGGPGADWVFDSGRSADVVQGDKGDDHLGDELSDADGAEIRGGPGVDMVHFFAGQVQPDGAAGPESLASWDFGTGQLTYTDPDDEFEVLMAGLEKVDLLTWGTTWTMVGTDADETVCAFGSKGTSFSGLGGDDVFQGSNYDDTFDGGDGDDHYFVSAGTDTYLDTEGVTPDDVCE